MKSWVNTVAEFQIQFKNITISKAIEQAKTNINCYKWSVTQRFLHTALPQIKVSLFFDPDTCDNEDDDNDRS